MHIRSKVPNKVCFIFIIILIIVTEILRAVHGGIAFYRAIEQLYSKGQKTVSFIVAKPETL